ncbi:ShlB/FhaC/HecB family hemolysin secretion/activation protein [Ferrovibrio sp.]|uniref:ShlB/FhaC/HecB family hemolysin secretion/activation protein n=1 Tax=Ferrovibrio sp. TaxID=1917215 RepID=UPI003D0E2F05
MTQPPPEQALPEKKGQSVYVKEFRIRSDGIPAEELAPLLQGYTGKRLSFSELQAAARKLSDYSRKKGKLAHAYLPPQTIRDGVVEIVLMQGRLGKVKVDPASRSRLDRDLAVGLIEHRLKPGETLDLGIMDEAVAVLKDVPGVKAEASLRAGEKEGETDAILLLEDKPLFSGSATLDNGGSTSTGVLRGLATINAENPFGAGEKYSAVALTSEGTRYARLAMALPVGYSGLVLGINASALEYEVGGRFANLGLNGYSLSAGGSATYPLLRGNELSFTLSGSYDFKMMQDRAVSATLNDKRINAAALGLSATVVDDWFGGGSSSLSLTGTAGHLNLDRSPDSAATDRTTAGTAGFYAKLAASAAREQKLDDAWTLITMLEVQASGSNLDSSEKFSLGGIDRVRAYPSGEGSGDSGGRVGLELRWKVDDAVKLSGFYDLGFLRQHTDPWSNWQPRGDMPNNYALQGIGLALAWTPMQALTLTGTLAKVIGRNAGHDASGNDADGNKHRYRAWLQAVLQF